MDNTEIELETTLDTFKCGICSSEIKEGDIYHSHDQYGSVCTGCPEFADGGIKRIEESEGGKSNEEK